MQRCLSPSVQIKTIHKENEDKSGILLALRAILALKQDKTLTSTFNLFAKTCCYGLTDEEKTILAQFRSFILVRMRVSAKTIMPEFFNDEPTMRILEAKGLTLEQQAEYMKIKGEFLYTYQNLLVLLYNLKPSIPLMQELRHIASRAKTLGDTTLAPKILEYLESATIKMDAR